MWSPYPDPSEGFLRDARGAHRTASLFKETNNTDIAPVFTMRSQGLSELPSAYEVYISSVDEADAAMKLVGSMQHWRKLLKSKWFMNGDTEGGFEGLVMWRKDMISRDLTRLKAVYLEQIRDGDLAASKAMLALLEKEMKWNAESVGAKTSGKGSAARRTSTLPPSGGNVFSIDDELARLKRG